MTKKKKPLKQYEVFLKITTHELAIVEATSEEEARAKAEAGDWQDPQHLETVDWEVGSVKEDK